MTNPSLPTAGVAELLERVIKSLQDSRSYVARFEAENGSNAALDVYLESEAVERECFSIKANLSGAA